MIGIRTILHVQRGKLFTRHFLYFNFMTVFTFRLTAAAARGFTFTSGDGPNAIGSAGSGLGYTVGCRRRSTGTAVGLQEKITHSFAVKFRSEIPTTRKQQPRSSAEWDTISQLHRVNLRQEPDLDLRSGNEITARLRYDGNNLFVQLTDPARKITTRDFQLLAGNIAQQIGSITGRAFIGFTGGTGGRSAKQEIIAWTFKEGIFE